MKGSTNSFVFLVSGLMFATGIIYFIAAYFELDEGISDHGPQIEVMLFSVIGLTHIPLGLWMIRNNMNSRAPYVISVVISLALIGLYVAARFISMPIVGLEGNTGIIDITSKVLQTGIIIVSILLLPELKKNQKFEIHGMDNK